MATLACFPCKNDGKIMENTISVHLWVKLYIIFVSRALAVVISGHFCRNAVSFTTAECYYLLCSLHRFIACIPRYPKVTGLSKKCWTARLVDFGEPLLLGSWYLSVSTCHASEAELPNSWITVPIRVSYRDATRFSELVSPQVLEK